MAILDPLKIPDMLSRKQRGVEFDRCVRHDKRAVMHTEAFDRESDIKGLQDFIAWADRILSPKKQEVFKHLLTFPLATVDISEGIFNELKKIFDAHNRVITHQFTNPTLIEDCNEYRNKIRDYNFWQTDGFSAMKSAINSIMIVDLPSLPYDSQRGEFNQTSERPEPYFYLLDIGKVIEMDVKTGVWRVEYIVFEDSVDKNTVHVFDDAFYRTYKKDVKGVMQLINQSPHDLGYCPARSFWTTPFSRGSKIQKLAPISKSLAAFDWLLFSIVLKRHLSLYAGYPMIQSYEQKCDYLDQELGVGCEGGFLRWDVPSMDGLGATVQRHKVCPRCLENRGGLGPGSHILVPPPLEDEHDMLHGIEVVGAEKDSLDYNKQEVEDQIAWITYNIIGIGEEMSREAVNEKQVFANFESRQTVLMDVKSNFENIHRWTTETWCRLRYGNQFVGCTVDYGSQFMLFTTAEILDMLKSGKEQGLPNFELDSIRTTLIQTKYRNNPDMLQRMKIMGELEPYAGHTIDELGSLKNLITIDKRLIELKANFGLYIKQFEREFTDIVSYMQFNDLQTKIDLMREKLLEYVKTNIEEAEPEAEAIPGNGNGNPGQQQNDDGGGGSGQGDDGPTFGKGQPAPGGATS